MDSIILLLNGCFLIPNPSPSPSVSQNECPDKPQTVLKREKIKSLTLTQQPIKESGITQKDKAVGYTFTGKSGQTIKYNTKEDICVWIYDPDQQIMSNTKLQKDGIYTIQVSSSQGSGTFQMEISLESSGNSSQPHSSSSTTSQNSPILTPSPSSTTSQNSPILTFSKNNQSLNKIHPDADQFVRNHYVLLNQQEYSKTWDELSSKFQQKSINYSGYQKWWNSVQEIRIGDIKLIKQTDYDAIVDAELWYQLKTGREVKDSKKRIYLIWDASKKQWLFDNKGSP